MEKQEELNSASRGSALLSIISQFTTNFKDKIGLDVDDMYVCMYVFIYGWMDLWLI